jgi:GT2 family glycosyltransferase
MDTQKRQFFPGVGAVAIGRNEGDRIARTLPSLTRQIEHVIYADSGSVDGSPERAAKLGVHVIAIKEPPHSAARGRQAGFDLLLKLSPNVTYVQFIDGDCTMEPTWLATAVGYMEEHPRCAALAGRRREEFPENSLYNSLIDIDWDAKVGPVDYLGGDCLCRVEAVKDIGGWNATLIAGEDPDFGFRLKDKGWEVHRVADPMDIHDVNMRSFRAYWARTVRAGYCYLEVGWLHRRGTGRWWLKRVRSSLLYGGLIPLAWVVGIVLMFFLQPWWIGLILVAPIVLIYLRLFFKLFTYARFKDASKFHSLAYAGINLLCKGALFQGTCKRLLWAMRGKQAALIEYKAPVKPVGAKDARS